MGGIAGRGAMRDDGYDRFANVADALPGGVGRDSEGGGGQGVCVRAVSAGRRRAVPHADFVGASGDVLAERADIFLPAAERLGGEREGDEGEGGGFAGDGV